MTRSPNLFSGSRPGNDSFSTAPQHLSCGKHTPPLDNLATIHTSTAGYSSAPDILHSERRSPVKPRRPPEQELRFLVHNPQHYCYYYFLLYMDWKENQ